jgi:hypothetical protein
MNPRAAPPPGGNTAANTRMPRPSLCLGRATWPLGELIDKADSPAPSTVGQASSATRPLEEVFVSWLEQRLKHRHKKEIEVMLLGELPDLEETQAGKDLIRIGEQRGLERGRQKTILAFIAARYGTVPAAIQERIATSTADEAERLIQFLARCQSLDELARWLGVETA